MIKLRYATAAGGLALTVAGLLLVMRKGKRRKVSRGTLVGDYLQSSRKPGNYARTVGEEHASYAGFNMVVGDTRDGVFYVSNRREARVQPLKDGVWAVANSTLEVPWEKLTRGKHLFRSVLHQVRGCMDLDDDTLADFVADQLLSRVLKDTHQCEPGETGYPRQFEKLLARICIDPPVYPWHTIGVKEGEFANAFGTVCHIIVLGDRKGVVRFYESSRDGEKGEWSERRKLVVPVTEEG